MYFNASFSSHYVAVFAVILFSFFIIIVLFAILCLWEPLEAYALLLKEQELKINIRQNYCKQTSSIHKS